MNEIFLTAMEISAATSIIILLIALLSKIIDKKFISGWKYWIWLLIALRLIVPFNPETELFQQKVEVEVPNVTIYSPETDLSTEPQIIIPEQNPGAQGSEIPGDKVIKPSKIEDESREKTSLLDVLAFVWVSGAAVMFLWNVGAYLLFRKITLDRSIAAENEIQTIFSEVKSFLGIKKEIKAVVCKNINSPMIMGFFSPILILPDEDYSEESLRFILCHELTHYKRHDTFYKALMLFANSVHWFNPVVFLMRKLADSDLEVSCDSKVVNGADIETRKQYSETILSCVHQEKLPCAVFSTHFYGGAKTLKKRFANILSTEKRGKGKVAFALVLILSFVLGGTVACTSAVPTEEDNVPDEEAIRELILNANAIYQPGDGSVLEIIGYENYINGTYYDEIGNFEEVSKTFSAGGIEQLLNAEESHSSIPAFLEENGRYYRLSSMADSYVTDYYDVINSVTLSESSDNFFIYLINHTAKTKDGETGNYESYITIVFEEGKYKVETFDSKRFMSSAGIPDEKIIELIKKAEAVYQPGNNELFTLSGLNNIYPDFPGKYDEIKNFDEVVSEIFVGNGIAQLKNAATLGEYYPVIVENGGKTYRISKDGEKDDVLYYETINSIEFVLRRGKSYTYRIHHTSSDSTDYLSTIIIRENDGKYFVESFENKRFDTIHYQTQRAREIYTGGRVYEYIDMINEQLESFRNGTFVENPLEPNGWPDYFPPVSQIPEMNIENLSLVWRNYVATAEGEREGIVWFLYRVDENYALIFEPITFTFIDRTETGISTSFADASMYGYENIDEWFNAFGFEGIYGSGFVLKKELYSEPKIIAEHIAALNQLNYRNYGAVLDGKYGTFLFKELPEDISVIPDAITFENVVYDGINDMHNGYYLDPFERSVQEVLNFGSVDEMFGYIEQYIHEDLLPGGFLGNFIEFEGKLYKATGNIGNIGITYTNCEVVSETENYMTVEAEVYVAYSGERYGSATIEFEKFGEEWKITAIEDRF